MGMGGRGSMQSMMQQAQRMQQNIEKVQNELAEAEVEATAGGGVVTAVVTGKKQLKKVTIAPEAVDPEDVEMLEDLITAAVNEALAKADAYAEEQMGKVTGGMNLGGLF
ncbi:MAG: YbaB/EbfC family nucleoid-associated protein [Christensenellaceae bacterium]